MYKGNRAVCQQNLESGHQWPTDTGRPLNLIERPCLERHKKIPQYEGWEIRLRVIRVLVCKVMGSVTGRGVDRMTMI